jgi:hypothetical protein
MKFDYSQDALLGSEIGMSPFRGGFPEKKNRIG